MRNFHFPGRSPVYGTQGMAATSHPLATLTAVEILRSGGNAVDAAIAASAVLCVVEPQSTGIGGDCFALYAPAGGEAVIALNGSGKAPAAAELAWYQAKDMTEIPLNTAHAVTIPGAIDAWSQLSGDYGRLAWRKLLQPAIRLAEQGYPVYPRVAYDWALHSEKLRQDENAARMLLIQGRAPRSGELHRQPELAATLRTIANQGRAGFYEGAIAADMVDYLRQRGGLHTLEDFARTHGDYVTPISTSYRGYEVLECPPNGQGLTALVMLNILSGFDLSQYEPLSTERLHLEAEAARLAYAVRDRAIADPAQAEIPVEELLSDDYAQQLRAKIHLDRAQPLSKSDFPTHADTIYLCVVDADGDAISFINSTFHGFGSGLVSPTGVVLQSRGSGFRLEAGHPNAIAPGKRPLHTIIPGMLRQKGQAVMPFGVMGGNYQPAGQVHLLTNLLDYGMDVQTALDHPRAFYYDNRCQLEQGIPQAAAEGLTALGYQVQYISHPHGGGQAIWIDQQTGMRVGGSDPRKDGCALGDG